MNIKELLPERKLTISFKSFCVFRDEKPLEMYKKSIKMKGGLQGYRMAKKKYYRVNNYKNNAVICRAVGNSF